MDVDLRSISTALDYACSLAEGTKYPLGDPNFQHVIPEEHRDPIQNLPTPQGLQGLDSGHTTTTEEPVTLHIVASTSITPRFTEVPNLSAANWLKQPRNLLRKIGTSILIFNPRKGMLKWELVIYTMS